MTSDSNFDQRKNSAPQAAEMPLECAHCHAKVPASVALGFEGADYLYHFCGPACFEAWRKTPAPPD
jgi:hypothetical protein